MLASAEKNTQHNFLTQNLNSISFSIILTLNIYISLLSFFWGFFLTCTQLNVIIIISVGIRHVKKLKQVLIIAFIGNW